MWRSNPASLSSGVQQTVVCAKGGSPSPVKTTAWSQWSCARFGCGCCNARATMVSTHSVAYLKQILLFVHDFLAYPVKINAGNIAAYALVDGTAATATTYDLTFLMVPAPGASGLRPALGFLGGDVPGSKDAPVTSTLLTTNCGSHIHGCIL